MAFPLAGRDAAAQYGKAQPMSLLSVVNLNKHYGRTSVLKGVSFELEEGECIALLGASGCGKTTTLRCIAGLEQLDGGQIRLQDRLLNDHGRAVAPQERNMGMVFQSYSVWPHLTVFENVAFGLKLRRIGVAEIRERVSRILGMMGIEQLAQRRSWQVSGGQLQRVALARTLVVEPKLVLFDEPLSNLDAKLRLHMRVEIRLLLKRLGMSAVYVTHDQSEASVVADKIAVMNEGWVEQIGSWEDLYYSPGSRFVADFMGSGNLLDGTVLEVTGTSSRVRLGKALATVSAEVGAGGETRPGEQVRVYVPREAVMLRPAGQGICAGRIEAVLPSAGVFEVTVSFGESGKLSAVKLSTDDLPAEGAECGVDFDARYLRILRHAPA